jgi:hypothetical protein
MQVKLREIQHGKIQIQYGFTVPSEIKVFFETGTFFTIERSGTAIILTSGTSNIPTEEQIKKYNFIGARI